MNYLFLHTTAEWSGGARVFAAAARGLARRGHKVIFVPSPDTLVEQVVSEWSGGANASLFDVWPMSIDGSVLGAAFRLRRLLMENSIDAIFVHSDREQLVAALAYRFGARVRIVRRSPAGRSLELTRSGRLAAWLAPASYLFASERTARAARLPRNALSRSVAQLGVEEALPQSAADLHGDDINMVCVQDASSRSRAATAVRTVAMLAPRHAALRLQVLGEGGYDDDLRMQSAALNALDLVSFLGERADQLEVMRGMRLGWVVADGDAGCYGILDLMSIGVPVLAPEQSVAQDYVLPDISGVLLPADDAFTTAAVVSELLINDARRETMGAAARVRVIREFAESEMIDGFELAAAEVAARRRK